MKRILLWTGEGLYTPIIRGEYVWWYKTSNDNPTFSAQVNSMAHAARFAQPVRVEAFDTQETRQ